MVADTGAFNAGYTQGQDEYDEGRFLEAARTWTRAAKFIPEAAEHRHDREWVYKYISIAYKKNIDAGYNEAVVREAHSVLDEYAAGFERAYPGEPLHVGVAEVRDEFSFLLAHKRPGEAPSGPQAPTQDSTPVTLSSPSQARPWKALAIGGGVATGAGAAMLVMFIAGLARTKSIQARFDAPARMCDLDFLVGECQEIFDDGTRAQAVARAGLISAPLLLGAGIAMLVISERRKSSQQALLPVLGPAMTGLMWERRF